MVCVYGHGVCDVCIGHGPCNMKHNMFIWHGLISMYCMFTGHNVCVCVCVCARARARARVRVRVCACACVCVCVLGMVSVCSSLFVCQAWCSQTGQSVYVFGRASTEQPR